MTLSRLALLFIVLLPLVHQTPASAQACSPGLLGFSRTATLTRLLVAGNAAGRPANQIAAALNQAMNIWNGSSCQSGGVSYPWFQSQASGAEERINIHFDSGLSDTTGGNGSTACAVFGPTAVPEIRLYTQFRDSQGNLYSCDSVDLGLQLAHELGHYLGLDHTSPSSTCSSHLMFPALDGNESLQPIECQLADSINETSWEAGEVGCTDDDWCDPDHCSPIVIDFAGDLFEFSPPEPPVRFDIDGTGRPRRIGWTAKASDDGFLCLDRNQNGRIDSGAELFGTATRLATGELAANGYEAMRELDMREFGGNQDGVLDSQDIGFQTLCVWLDTNRNARSEQNEISSLEANGVRALGLGYSEFSYLDGHKNLLLLHGDAIIEQDGLWRLVRTVDVFFAASPDGSRGSP